MNSGIKTNTTNKYNTGMNLFLTANSESLFAAFIGIRLRIFIGYIVIIPKIFHYHNDDLEQ